MKEHKFHNTIVTATTHSDYVLNQEHVEMMNDYFKSILEFYKKLPFWYEVDETLNEYERSNYHISFAYKMDIDQLNINMSGMFFGKDYHGMNNKHFKFFTVNRAVNKRAGCVLLEHRVVAKNYD